MQDPDLVFADATAHIKAAMEEASAIRRVELLEEGLRLNRLAGRLRKFAEEIAPAEAAAGGL